MLETINRFYDFKENEITALYVESISRKKVIPLLKHVDCNDIVRKILAKEEIVIDSASVPQFSSFNKATIEICRHLKYSLTDSLGYDFIGMLLIGEEKKTAAMKKYGENHSKMAEMMGLVFIDRSVKPHKVKLTQLGNEVADISSVEFDVIKDKLILRTHIIQYLLWKSSRSTVKVSDEISFLKQSTIYRRLPNIRKLFLELSTKTTDELSFFVSSIDLR